MKKLLSIIALCLIAIIAGTIVIFAVVDKDYNLNLTKPDYIEIKINNNSNAQSYYADDEFADRQAVYNEVMKLYNESFKQKIMSAIFGGTISSKPTIQKQYSTSFLSSGTFIIFNYEDEQELMLNGKSYEHKKADGTISEKNIKYKTLYVEVKDSTAMTDFNIYVKYENSSNSTASYYRYTVKAQQSKLYQYLQENFA